MPNKLPPSPSLQTTLLRCGMSFFLFAAASILLSRGTNGIAALWLANATGISFLVTQARARWPALLLSIATANILVGLIFGDTLKLAFLFAFVNVLEVGFASFLIKHFSADQAFNESPNTLFKVVVLGSLFPALLSATVGSTIFYAEEIAPFSKSWPIWYAGSVIGTVATLPSSLLMLQKGIGHFFQQIIWRQFVLQALLSISLTIFVLMYLPFPFVYVMLPMIFAAINLSFEGFALILWLIALTTGSVIYSGNLTAQVVTTNWQLLLLYLPILAAMFPPLLLAGSTQQGRLKEKARALFEQAVQRSNEELQTIIDHMPALVVYWDNQLVNRFANSAYLEWFGMAPQQMRGKHIKDIVGADRFQEIEPHLQSALQGNSPIFERTIRYSSGQERHALFSYVPDIVDGEVVGFYGFINDISQLKEAQAAQAAALTQLQYVVNAASAFSIIASDLKGNIFMFSLGAEKMLGYLAEEIVDKATLALFHLQEEVFQRGIELTAELGRTIEGFNVFIEHSQLGATETREWTYVRKDSSHLPVQLTVSPIHGNDGQITGFLGVAKDISQEKQVTEELHIAMEKAEAGNRAKSEFVANMSHELRTPMNAVLGITHLLNNTALSVDQKKYLGMIRASGQALLNILNDILDFSKIEAGRMELSPTPFLLDDLMNTLAATMSVNVGEKNLELAIGIEPDVPRRLIGDVMRLQQVLVNLTGNAIKFTEHGEVSLLVTMVAQLANLNSDMVIMQFSVRDTGIGMNNEQQLRLFSSFTQVDSSITRRFGGTGLGLTISKRLVELMGGTIEIHSEFGQGSEFCISIPFQVTADQKDASRPQHALGNLRFLVVDDNDTSRDYLRKTINAWNWQVDSVPSGAKAMEALLAMREKDEHYDVVLVDWQMPGMDGLTTINNIRKSNPKEKIPVILMVNAYGRSKLMETATGTQADAILTKPVTGSSLFDTLHEILIVRSVNQGEPQIAADDLYQQSEEYRLDGRHFLLAEDNLLNQIVAKGMLEHAGATVDIADNGQIALDRLQDCGQTYDLVLMDVQMPVMDGFTATRKIRNQLKMNLPILAITAGVTDSERRKCLESGMNDFIAKPIEPAHMFTTIAKHLSPNRIEPPISRTAPPAPISTPILVPTPTSVAKSDDDDHSNEQKKTFNAERFLGTGKDNPVFRNMIIGLLKRIIDRGLHPIIEARQAWDEGRAEDAARVFHTIRGTVGMLGAKRFSDITVEMEVAIHANEKESVNGLFILVEQELSKTLTAASLWLSQQAPLAPPPESDAHTLPAFDMAQIGKLRILLSEKDLSACDLYPTVRSALLRHDRRIDLRALDQAMEKLDFSEAINILKVL